MCYVCAWVATAPRAGESCARSCAWVLLAREQCLVARKMVGQALMLLRLRISRA